MADRIDSEEFILEEIRYHLKEYQRSEQLGEARLELFIKIATAVLGGSGLIFYGKPISTNTGFDKEIIFIACLATLLFGLLTLQRMIRRNVVSSQEIRAANRARRYFVDRDCSIVKYMTYLPYDDAPIRKFHLRGGLVDTVMLANSLLHSVLTVVFVEINGSQGHRWLIGTLAFLAASIIQFIFVKGKYNESMEKAKRESKFPTPKEVELSLIINSDDPDPAAKIVDRLATIKDFKLKPGPHQEISDCYFDACNSLCNCRLALRIRIIDGKTYVTMKGPSKLSDIDCLPERPEIEEKWSEDALKNIMRELQQQGAIKCPSLFTGLIDEFEAKSPTDVMSLLGLKQIQKRSTSRVIWHIVSCANENAVLAELAIDCIRYHFEYVDIKYHEVEIEAKIDSVEARNAAIQAAKFLLHKFPKKEIRGWRHAKLPTGMAIEALLKNGDLQRHLDEDNKLKPSAFNKIECWLHQKDKDDSML